jgi:tRNA (adenine57-N1/adenine58-N1)-methyltransferase
MTNGLLLRRFVQQIRSVSTFAPGDRVLVHSLKRNRTEGLLTKPLTLTGVINYHGGDIKHADIIGKTSASTVVSAGGTICRLLDPTLGEYVCLTKRLVTPIYPSNTNILVSLLDINPTKAGDEIHILEAGTGHGSLTLHLARAIHGCNPPLPVHVDSKAIEDWKKTRTAVIHTLDISAKHSAHAEMIVKEFRRGVYAPSVDFHVGDIPSFLENLPKKQKKFLTHVILDMPNPEERLPAVAEHLRDDGIVLIFNPSITQITECVEKIAKEKLPLWLETVYELTGGMSGGREWDVRMATLKKPPTPVRKPGTLENHDNNTQAKDKPKGVWAWITGLFLSPQLVRQESKDVTQLPKSVMVCRPKAGHQVPVGGFVGVWTKKISTAKDV